MQWALPRKWVSKRFSILYCSIFSLTNDATKVVRVVGAEERHLSTRHPRSMNPSWPTGPFPDKQFGNISWLGITDRVVSFHDRVPAQLSCCPMVANPGWWGLTKRPYSGRWGSLTLKSAVIRQSRILVRA